ncbi:MAG: hypothetical protein WBN23_10670 [Woeseia sp.]
MKTIFLLAMLGLVACGDAQESESRAPEAPVDDLTGTIDKAEAVEQQLQEQKERMDRALEEAEQPPE